MKVLDQRAQNLVLAALAAVTLVLVAWIETRTWRAIEELRQHTETASSSQYHRADFLQAEILKINMGVTALGTNSTRNQVESLRKHLAATRTWLESQISNHVDEAQRRLSVQLLELLRNYERHTNRGLDDLGLFGEPSYAESNEELVRKMVATGQELAAQERVALAGFMHESRRRISDLHRLVAGATAVLVIAGVLIAWAGYQGIIAPLQRKLRQSRARAERQEKLASLGQLAAGVAHEIRNPLTSMKVRLFTQRRALSGNSEALEDNAFITAEISRLERIVKDILTFARPGEPQLQRTDVSAVVHHVAQFTRPELEKAGILVREDYEDDLVLQVDPEQLRQVLLNLVRNAAEAIGQRGEITLRTRTRSERSRGGVKMAVLEVEDTGQGIPPDVQKRLFDPFFTTKAGGTGLGLSISARLVEQQGGRLEYQTQPGKGTVFSIVLPLTPTA